MFRRQLLQNASEKKQRNFLLTWEGRVSSDLHGTPQPYRASESESSFANQHVEAHELYLSLSLYRWAIDTIHIHTKYYIF